MAVRGSTIRGIAGPTPQVAGITDHGALDGLADDDHSQYLTAAEGAAAFAPISQPILAEATDDYTAVLSDANGWKPMNKATAVVFEIPAHADVPYPVGTQLMVEATGAGETSITGDGFTPSARGGALKIAGQFGVAICTKRAASDTWNVSGDITA